jgi:hypothetical protein
MTVAANGGRTGPRRTGTSEPARSQHVFQAFAALLDEGDAALNRAARFIEDHVSAMAAA